MNPAPSLAAWSTVIIGGSTIALPPLKPYILQAGRKWDKAISETMKSRGRPGLVQQQLHCTPPCNLSSQIMYRPLRCDTFTMLSGDKNSCVNRFLVIYITFWYFAVTNSVSLITTNADSKRPQGSLRQNPNRPQGSASDRIPTGHKDQLKMPSNLHVHWYLRSNMWMQCALCQAGNPTNNRLLHRPAQVL